MGAQSYYQKATPKFPMHGLHHSQAIRQICIGGVLSVTGSIMFYIFYYLPRRAAYKNFYSNYNPNASFERMKEGGYLQSCPASSSESDKDKKDKK